jgi:hypothetical protein
MAFLPAPQPTRPQNVAMRVKETDTSVFPTHTQVDLRRQQQEAFEHMNGKLNAAVLDKHFRPPNRTMTQGERQGFTRCNGNIIAPGDVPYKPWEPKSYHTKEHLQSSLDVFGQDERRKASEAIKMMQSKEYFSNFTKQPPHPHGKAMLHIPLAEQHVPVEISGFRGLGHYSPELVHGKSHGELQPAVQKLPPWLQEDGISKHRERHNPSMYSDGVAPLLGRGGNTSSGPSPQAGDLYDSPSRGQSIERGVAYPAQKSHKKIYHIPDSTGGHASPVGAKIPSREEGTTSQSAFYRYDALSQGRAHTSMLP